MSGPVAYLHVISAVLALAFGVGIFTTRRGTPSHRRLGYGYIASMAVMNSAALSLYARTGEFGPFHLAALISLATLAAGALPVIVRRPRRGWLPVHWEFMSWSFVGLVAAAIAEAAFRIPGVSYWPSIVAGTILVFFAGGACIYKSRGAMRQFISAQSGATGDP
jgi:uncharacterized membrane protein